MPAKLLRHSALVGFIAFLFYVACLLWRYTMTDPEVMRFHLLSLKTLFPGFNGYTAPSMIWGAVLIFVYAFAASVIFHSLHRDCCRGK